MFFRKSPLWLMMLGLLHLGGMAYPQTVSVAPAVVPSPAIGEPLTLALKIADGENVSGYKITVQFDPTALQYVESANGDYFPTGALFVQPIVRENQITLISIAVGEKGNGDGTLATLTFSVVALKASAITLFQVTLNQPPSIPDSTPRIKNGAVTLPRPIREETRIMVIKGTITNTDGTPAPAGVPVTVTIGTTTITEVSEAGGAYRVTFVNLTGRSVRSTDTVSVSVEMQGTSRSARTSIQLSSAQIHAQSATIDLQLSIVEPMAKRVWTVPAGISFIHVPLSVSAVDGVPMPIESVSDLYDALGGAETVNLLITIDPTTQRFLSYLGAQHKGKKSDKPITDALGLIASMKTAVSITLSGDVLGVNGRSSIPVQEGINIVGMPLKDSRITTVSDLFRLDGMAGNVSTIIVSDNGTFSVVARRGDAGDSPLTPGQGFMLTARSAATVAITSEGF